jgi:hypothetical protein
MLFRQRLLLFSRHVSSYPHPPHVQRRTLDATACDQYTCRSMKSSSPLPLIGFHVLF